MTFIYYFAIALFILIAVILCFVILIQENKSLGLGASFGGDAGSSLFGTSTATVIKKLTAWLAVIFLVGSVLLSLWTSSLGRTKNESGTPTTEQQLEP